MIIAMHFRILYSCFFLYITPILFAQTIGDVLDPDTVHLDQIVIRGPLLPNKVKNIPSSFVILSNDNITQSVSNTYIDQLNQVAGIFVHSGTMNTNRITIRGIGSRTPYATNRIKAYYNGIPLTTGDGTTVIEDIDPSMIKSIEIVKGAKSALYGSGLGGIILISGNEYFKQGLHGKAGIEAGMFGTYRPEMNIHYQKNKLAINTAYAYTNSKGWRQNSSYHRHNMNINAVINDNKSKTQLLLQLIDIKAFIPSSLNYETYKYSPDSAAASWLKAKGYEKYRKLLSGINHVREISPSIESSTTAFLNVFNGYEVRPFNILDDDAIQTGINSQMNFTRGKFRIRVGFEMIYENYNWNILDTDLGIPGELLKQFEEVRLPLSLFAQSGYNFENGGNIEIGLSYNHLKYRLLDNSGDSLDLSGSYSYNPVFSPFLGINMPIGDKIRMYGSVGHGYSPPTVEETLLPEGDINSQLKPESGINLELGSRFYGLDGDLYFDASLYMLLVKDLLVTKRISEDIFYGANAGASNHGGLELVGGIRMNKYQLNSLPEVKIHMSFTISDNRFKDFIDDGANYSGNHLPGIPSSLLWGNLSFIFKKGFYINYQYQNTGMQYLDDKNSQTYSGYQISSLKLGIRLKHLAELSSEVYLGIQNLFNEHYASMILVNAPSFGNALPRYYYPGQPRYIYGGIRISF